MNRSKFVYGVSAALALGGCAGAGTTPIDSDDSSDVERHHRGPVPSPSPSAAASSAPTANPIPGALAWGVTLDSVDGASSAQIASIVTMLKALPVRPWARFVVDSGSSAATSNYSAAVSAIAPVSSIMLEICDSSYVKATSSTAYSQITADFLASFPNIDLWEVGNELNGEWLGGKPYAGSGAAVGTANPPLAKAYASWKLLKAARKKTALTLYYEPAQTVTPGYDMVPWARANFASLADMATGLDKVLVSYYETDNDNVRPTQAEWTTLFAGLQAVFPNAHLGFGEIGIDDAVTSATLSKAESIMSYYYGLKPAVDNWWGGYFWWYGQEDLTGSSKPLLTLLKDLM